MNHYLQTFYLFTATQILSLLGSRMTAFALALRISIDTGQATPVAMVAFFQTVPEILLSNVGGLVADRFDRRIVMAVADAGQAVGTVLLMIAFFSNQFELWHLYAITFLQSIFLAFQRPASEAVTAVLVPDDHRDRANALRQMSDSLAGIFAPALAALLLIPIGVVGIMMLDFATFIVAVIVIPLLSIPVPPKSAESERASESFWRSLSAGYQFLWQRRPLFALILFSAVVNFVLSATTTIIIPYVLARTGSEQVAGWVSVSENLGIILGGVVIGAWGNSRGKRTLIFFIGGAFVMFAQAIFGILQTPLALCIGMFAIVFPLPIANVPFFSMLQAKVPPDMQGRVFAVSNQLSGFTRPLGLFLIGPFVDLIAEPAIYHPNWAWVAPIVGAGAGSGMGLLFLVTGVVVGLLTLAMLLFPAIRTMEHDLPDYHVDIA